MLFELKVTQVVRAERCDWNQLDLVSLILRFSFRFIYLDVGMLDMDVKNKTKCKTKNIFVVLEWYLKCVVCICSKYQRYEGVFLQKEKEKENLDMQ